jgi:microcystin degradation protein MlrC
MHVAIGGLQHETNTFTTLKTSLEDFVVAEGEEMLSIPPAVRDTSMQGIIEVCQEQGVEIIPTLFAYALPSGTITKDTYENLKGRLLAGISGADRLDAIVLAMHGSMYVEDIGDADGDLLASLRELVGPEVPIVCALDLHATITEQMIENADGFVGYRTAPHVDKVATGRRACELAIRAVQESLELCTQWVSIPMIVSGEQSETRVPPTSEIIKELVHMPEVGEIISSSIFLGFPWADVPYSCVSTVVVTSKAAAPAGKQEAKRLAQYIWDKRDEFVFTTEAYDLDKCLDIAEEEESCPIIIADCGDNPTAGSSEDLSNVLDVLIQRSFKNALVAVIVDEDSYAKCVEAGANKYVELDLGRVNPTEEEPRGLSVRAYVERIGTGKGIPSAVLRIDDIWAIVTTQRTDVYDPKFLKDLKLDPFDYNVIVVKSGYLSPEYQALTKRPMLALTPGDTNPLLETVPYRQVKRPIYPVDKDFEWTVES